MAFICAMRSSAVTPEYRNRNSTSWRGIPVDAEAVCRSCRRCVISGSAREKSFSKPTTGVDQLSLPWSISFAITGVVSGLVEEPIMKRERGVTGAGSSTERTPNPSANTTFPSRTTAIETPGICNTFIP